MSQTIELSVSLTSIHCSCGGTYAISERFRKQKQETGGTWHCPYCQTGWGYKESENDKLKKQLAAKDSALVAERSRKDQLAAELRDTQKTAKREKAYLKGNITKIKKKISQGECPCCGQQFKDLHQHMTEAHPEYTTTEEPAEEAAKEEKEKVEN